ncbi:TPA: amidohydrolase family protein [Thermoplasmata archaeon]|nr:amidohydrolase family protein [Thermoplasmata archaeon]
MADEYLGRWVFTADGLVPGCVRAEAGEAKEILLETPPSDSRRSIVLPAFVNSHTHLGDSFAYPAPKGSVEEIVGPGGFKHRALGSASDEEKRSGMRTSLDVMWRTGTTRFVDFREEGVAGVNGLLEAERGSMVSGVVLGRPSATPFDEAELTRLLDRCDGLAFSSISDWSIDVLERASRMCKGDGKMFALHASESRREDIDDVLGLNPDFLVHMTSASDDDLGACAEAGVPVVVCPRSNSAFGLRPDIPRLLELGLSVALGTDNAMICVPDMLSEIRAAYALGRGRNELSPTDVVSLATYSGHKVLNPKGKITTELSTSDDLVLVDVQGEDPLLELVSSDGVEGVAAVIQDGRIRRTGDWKA